MADRLTWNERYAATDLVWSSAPNQLFERITRGVRAGSALDLACGEGRNAIYLAEQGWQVTAIDFSDVAISKGRRLAHKRRVDVDWRVGDLNFVPLPVGVFDLVAVVFLHSSPQERVTWLPQAVNAVSRRGLFVYIGHDPRNVDEGVGGPQDTTLLPSADELCACLPAAFEVLQAEVVSRPVASDPGHGGTEGVALDTLVVARRR